MKNTKKDLLEVPHGWILYGMSELNITSTTNYIKSARGFIWT